MAMFCFVVTHSFFHCFGCTSTLGMLWNVKQGGFLVALNHRWVVSDGPLHKGWIYNTLSGYLRISSQSFNKMLTILSHKQIEKTTFKCSTLATYWQDRFPVLRSTICINPPHKLQQTAVNNSSFTIKWVYWIQLFYSCSNTKHMASDTN